MYIITQSLPVVKMTPNTKNVTCFCAFVFKGSETLSPKDKCPKPAGEGTVPAYRFDAVIMNDIKSIYHRQEKAAYINGKPTLPGLFVYESRRSPREYIFE